MIAARLLDIMAARRGAQPVVLHRGQELVLNVHDALLIVSGRRGLAGPFALTTNGRAKDRHLRIALRWPSYEEDPHACRRQR